MKNPNNFGELENFSDDELILMLQNGRDDVFEVIKERYAYLIKSFSSIFSNAGLEFDDFEQEAVLGLLNAVKTYNKSSAASFKTYATICIKRKVLSAYRSATRKKHLPLNNFLPLDSKSIENILVDKGPEQEIIDKERLDKLVTKIKTMLSRLEFLVLVSYLEGNDYEQIASSLEISVKSVNNALQRVRKKLKA